MTLSQVCLNTRTWSLLFLCWLIACTSTLGALFFSEVLHRIPCVLCWYQRIFMFPLPLILGVGVLTNDPRCTRYALPLSVTGAGFASYHCMLYLGVISTPITPCVQGVSCSDVQVELAGFITLPLMSLAAFVLLSAALFSIHQTSVGGQASIAPV